MCLNRTKKFPQLRAVVLPVIATKVWKLLQTDDAPYSVRAPGTPGRYVVPGDEQAPIAVTCTCSAADWPQARELFPTVEWSHGTLDCPLQRSNIHFAGRTPFSGLFYSRKLEKPVPIGPIQKTLSVDPAIPNFAIAMG